MLRYAGLAFIAAIIVLLSSFYPLHMVKSLLSQEVTYGVIFMIGLITGIHCIGMCGGLMISSAPEEGKGLLGAAQPTLLYNAGRILSYTATGGIIGALGSALAISVQVKLWIIVLSGLLMVIMGLNMAGFNLLRSVFIRIPTAWSTRIRTNGPLSLGLLTGLFPCGPLQIMQMYALGTGNAVAGATAMLIFALGTTPAMLPVGIFSGLLTRSTSRSLLQFSGVLVIVLGILMTNRGLDRLGIKLFF
jgi:sulfite exporter TauE/SafE